MGIFSSGRNTGAPSLDIGAAQRTRRVAISGGSVRTLAAALIIAALSLVGGSAMASLTTTGTGSASGGGGPPPTCSNKLDFSQACNSQYVGIL